MVDNNVTSSFPEMYAISEEEADYYMPLTQEECNDLRFALNLAMIRASNENDTETLEMFDRLYTRVTYGILLADE
jgi:hypothetical protein